MSDLPVPVTVTSKLDTRFAQRGELRFQLQEDEPAGRGPRLGGTVNTSVGSPLDPKFSAELRKGSAQRPPQLTTAAEPKRSRMARICAEPSRPVGAATSARTRRSGCLNRGRTAKGLYSSPRCLAPICRPRERGRQSPPRSNRASTSAMLNGRIQSCSQEPAQ